MPDLVLQRLWEWMRYLSKRKGGLEVLVPEVFEGVTAVMNAASEQLVAGTCAPKQSRERGLAQLRQLGPLLRDDGESAWTPAYSHRKYPDARTPWDSGKSRTVSYSQRGKIWQH